MAIMTRFFKGLHGPIQLSQIKVRRVETNDETARWNQLICKHHYLHDASLCGRQFRYIAECRGKCRGFDFIWDVLLAFVGPR